ncbi:hypothetical protein ACWGOE_03135 [Leucobacter chromiiresistens]
MEQSTNNEPPVEDGGTVELRGGRAWELMTTAGERVVVDQGFSANGGSTRKRWRHAGDGSWQRLFGIRPVGAKLSEAPSDDKHRLRVVIGSRIEIWTGFRDVWRTEAPLVAVREFEQPEA